MLALKFDRPLREHQAYFLEKFGLTSEFFLLWEMGTGKTTGAIAWLRAKFWQAGDVTNTLIISPVATLYNWQDEFKINSPPRVYEQVLVPYMRTKRTKYTGAERAQLIGKTDKKILILNPAALDNEEVCQALKKFAPKNAIVDEVHTFKNPKMFSASGSKKKPSRLSSLLYISDFAANRMAMTGTLIANSYLDIWAQFRFLDRGATFGTNFFTFRETYFEDKNVAWRGKPKYFPNWQPKREADALISNKLSAKSMRKTKAECLDLPPQIFMKHYVELSDEQAKAYREMDNELITQIRGGTCAAVNALSKVNKLLQILSGHVPVEYGYDEEKVVTHFQDNPRLNALKDLLIELTPNHKVIVWSSFKATYAKLRILFKELDLEWAELTGETKDRQGEITRFKEDPRCRVMLSNAQSGGVGVNLIEADYAIYYSRNYSLLDRGQSLARNHRDGSQKWDNITYVDLVAKDTLDEDVLLALLRKENFADNILDRLKNR